ncbi:MAG: SRPBCC family protein [Gemmatimonadales bacterium]
MSDQKSTDRIEQHIQLPTPRGRVWRALTESRQFGEWFGVKFDEPFKAGAPIKGTLTIKGYEHLTMEFAIDAIVPESRFSFRWHPYAIDPNVDYSMEPMTLVEFTLEAVDGGTLLKVVESGFDKIPVSRRVKAFEMNTSGWTSQMKNIAKYLAAGG